VKELGPFGWALRWKVLKQKAARGELPKGSPIYAIFGLGPKEKKVEDKKAVAAPPKKAEEKTKEKKKEAPVETLSIPDNLPQGSVTL
jgi:hypothetical protein